MHKFKYYFLIVVLLLTCSQAWGGDEGAAPVNHATESGVVVVAEAEERKMFNDEPREMPGIVFGSIIVNLILLTVFFALLRKEWKKHRKPAKPSPNSQCEEK